MRGAISHNMEKRRLKIWFILIKLYAKKEILILHGNIIKLTAKMLQDYLVLSKGVIDTWNTGNGIKSSWEFRCDWIYAYGEPAFLIMTSQRPTCLVMQLERSMVTVPLDYKPHLQSMKLIWPLIWYDTMEGYITSFQGCPQILEIVFVSLG